MNGHVIWHKTEAVDCKYIIQTMVPIKRTETLHEAYSMILLFTNTYSRPLLKICIFKFHVTVAFKIYFPLLFLMYKLFLQQ